MAPLLIKGKKSTRFLTYPRKKKSTLSVNISDNEDMSRRSGQ